MAKMGKYQLRHELKYIIPEGEYALLRDKLMAIMPLDNHADPATRSYFIRSLYFDDIDNTALTEKEAGVQVRSKWRIRTYTSGSIHLEKKMKFNQMTAKDSLTISSRQADTLIAGNWYNIPLRKHPLLDELYSLTRTRLLRPIVLVDYWREPYTFPAGNVRVTFDKDVHSGQFCHNLYAKDMMPIPVLEPGTLIMEDKYDDFLPAHIGGILHSVRGSRLAISKYALSRGTH